MIRGEIPSNWEELVALIEKIKKRKLRSKMGIDYRGATPQYIEDLIIVSVFVTVIWQLDEHWKRWDYGQVANLLGFWRFEHVMWRGKKRVMNPFPERRQLRCWHLCNAGIHHDLTQT